MKHSTDLKLLQEQEQITLLTMSLMDLVVEQYWKSLLQDFQGEIWKSRPNEMFWQSLLKAPADKERQYAHKGISYRTFSRNWQMADDVEVEEVDFTDGLLTITLKKELPEKQKRKKHF